MATTRRGARPNPVDQIPHFVSNPKSAEVPSERRRSVAGEFELARRRAATMSTASASSSRCALRRKAPPFPLISCPDCGRVVKQFESGTAHHPGWVFFKCQRHGMGCNFWHWELEYIGYLIDNNFLQGDAAADALGWADERRDELELRMQEKKLTTDRREEVHLLRIHDAVKEMVLLLKIVLALLCVMPVLFALLAAKK